MKYFVDDINLDTYAWSVPSPLTLEPTGGGNGQLVSSKVKDLGFHAPLLNTLEFVGSQKQDLGQPHTCFFWIQGTTYTYEATLLKP